MDQLLCGGEWLIQGGFEGGEAKAVKRLKKGFLTAFAQGQIAAQDAFDGRDDLVIAEARTSAPAKRKICPVIAPKGDLVVFNACSVEAQDTDMAHVMMPAGIDAARNF